MAYSGYAIAAPVRFSFIILKLLIIPKSSSSNVKGPSLRGREAAELRIAAKI